MKVLLDECVDPRFSTVFTRHECHSVKSMNWLGLSNGTLLKAAEQEFEAFVTIDQNIAYQQNLAAISLVVVVIRPADQLPRRPKEAIAKIEILLDVRPKNGLHYLDVD